VTLRLGESSRAFLRDIPDKVWKTLCLVLLRMAPDGSCRVTDADLAEDLRSTRTQAAKRLKELAEWRLDGRPLIVPEEGSDGTYVLCGSCGPTPSVLVQSGPEKPCVSSDDDEPPTTQDLIRELARKYHKVPGVQVLRGNYSLIGRALATYGYEAVSAAIDDLMYEADLRGELGQPAPSGSEWSRLLMQRAAWNKKAGEGRAGGQKQDFWDLYAWNEGRDRLVPVAPDVPFEAKVVGNRIVLSRKEAGTSQ